MAMSSKRYNSVKIGLEIHHQLDTDQKLFCKCPTNFYEADTNTNICPICMSLPGSKPMPINQRALDTVIEVALLLNCNVVVDKGLPVQRKHYFYPDLPSGYQRTSVPIGVDGLLDGIRITEVHIEEDPGRYDLLSKTIDFNRTGVPLVEIVTEPDLTSPAKAREFAKTIRETLSYTGKLMKGQGSMRADTNISIEGNNRVEVKNINSASNIQAAAEYELMRQSRLLKRGMPIKLETRGFVENPLSTIPLRSKEVAADYRYIPDPDLTSIIISEDKLAEVQEITRVGPIDKRELYLEAGLSHEHARKLTTDYRMAELFDQTLEVSGIHPAELASFFTGAIASALSESGIELSDSYLTPERISSILEMSRGRRITTQVARQVVGEVVVNDIVPADYVEIHNLESMIHDEIVEAVDEALNRNPDVYSSGKPREKIDKFMMGQVMKLTEGRADPLEVKEILQERVNNNT